MPRIPTPQLSDIEQYLLFDNHAGFPLDFSYRLQFDQRLKVEALNDCFRRAMEFHPLLRSIVKRNWRRWCWVLQPADACVIIEKEDEADSFRTPINLTQEHGVRLIVKEAQQGTCLVFEFHHTATDGLGAMGFISDVLQMYDGLQILPTSRNVALLKQRHICGYPKDRVSNYIRKHVQAIKLASIFANAKICPLVEHQPDRDSPRSLDDCAQHITHRFTNAETLALRSHAKANKVSLNTLLVRDAFVVFDAVRQTFDGYDAEGNIRIAIPGDLRSTGNNVGFPAANFFSMIFPHKNTEQIANQDQLLADIDQDVKSARGDYYLAIFRLSLKILRRIPGRLQREVNQEKCHATILLTNVGSALKEIARPDQTKVVVKGAVLESIELVAPIRPFQTIAVSTIEYAGQQTVTFTYDPRIHSHDEANGILEMYVRQLTTRVES